LEPLADSVDNRDPALRDLVASFVNTEPLRSIGLHQKALLRSAKATDATSSGIPMTKM
jgi:hypothetical protein